MKDIDFEKHVFYRRFLVRFDDFKRTFLSNDVQKDLDCLPDCTKQDSLERWLEIYENAFLHFTGVIQDNDPRFIENYELLVDIYGEGVIYPTKRKIEYIKELLSLNTETTPLLPQQAETKTPTAPAIALFCNIINEAEIIKKESNEIPATYCKRICENYKLKYTDRVRQNFNGKKSQKHYKELIERILPCIDVTIKDKIQKHLDSRNPPNQKLYG